MDSKDRPTKEQVRDWLMHRHVNPGPPPGMEQIRRELGWDLAEKWRAARTPSASHERRWRAA
jgi:hypothetical protein